MKKQDKIKVIAIAMILTLGITSTPASATSTSEDVDAASYSADWRTTYEKGLSYITSKNVSSHRKFTLRINGKNVSVSGLYLNGVAYIPFRASANALGISYQYDSKNRTALMNGGGLALSATDGCYSIYANDRPLFSTSPAVIMNDGRLYIPAESFAKATGLKLALDGSSASLSGSFSPLASAAKFYREDEVLWLARIIHAESSGEPLLGKIAVGNVVLNRVKSPSYPNTIYGVIFDRKYGVQFSPIIYGTIYNTPDYQSVLAAKICLEGFDISDGALFFLHPEISTSSWIPSNRPYLFSVGRHDFYG